MQGSHLKGLEILQVRAFHAAYKLLYDLPAAERFITAICQTSDEKFKEADQAKIADKLAKIHKKINLKQEELLKITNWVDTNSQFYGSYWGRKNLRYKNHPNYRPVPDFATATSMVSPIPEKER